jgi:hypothetical protein
MGDDPLSEMSPWNASHEHSGRGHVFNLARIVAAAFQDVISRSRQRDSFASTPSSPSPVISRSFPKTSVMPSPENEELAAFDLTTLCPDSTRRVNVGQC